MSKLIFEQELRITPPVPRGELTAAIREAEATVTDPLEVAKITAGIRERLSTPIIVVLQVATHAGSYRRATAIREAIEYVKSRVPEAVREERDRVTLGDVAQEVSESFMVLRNAADIIGCIVPSKCVGFDVPTTLEGWLEVPDYLMAPMMMTSWELNPHWAHEYENSKNE